MVPPDQVAYQPDLLGGVGTLEVPAWTAGSHGWGDALYRDTAPELQSNHRSRHSVSALGTSRAGQHGASGCGARTINETGR